MLWILENLAPRTNFNDLPKIHHRHTMGYPLNNRHVVTDEYVGKSTFFLQFHHQINDLCLNGDIKRGNRLVGNENIGISRESTRYTDTLTLPRKLMRITMRMLWLQTHVPKQFHYTLLDFPFASPWVISGSAIEKPTVSRGSRDAKGS